MRTILLAAFFTFAFSSGAFAENWDNAYGVDFQAQQAGYQNVPLPAYQAQQAATYPAARPVSQPAVNYQTPAIPDYLPETRSQAQGVQLYGAPAGTPIAGQQQAYAQQAYPAQPPLYAAVPAAAPYGQPPAYQATQQSYSQQQYQVAQYQAPQGYQQPAYPQAPQQQQPQPYQQQAYAQQAQPQQAPQAYGGYGQQPPQYQQQAAADPWAQSYQAQPAQQAYAYESQPQAPAPRAGSDADEQPAFAMDPRNRSRSGYYFALRSGFTMPDTVSFKTAGTTVNSEYKTGWDLGAAFGYSFAPWARWVAPRAEFEISSIRNSIDSHTISGTRFADPVAFGDLTALNFMANGYTDFYINRWFQPYLGAGFGAGYVDLDRQGTNPTGVIMDNDNIGFAWQAAAGFNLPIGGGTMLDLGYRYMQTADVSLTSAVGTKSDVTTGNHIIEIGVRSPINFY